MLFVSISHVSLKKFGVAAAEEEDRVFVVIPLHSSHSWQRRAVIFFFFLGSQCSFPVPLMVVSFLHWQDQSASAILISAVGGRDGGEVA